MPTLLKTQTARMKLADAANHLANGEIVELKELKIRDALEATEAALAELAQYVDDATVIRTKKPTLREMQEELHVR